MKNTLIFLCLVLSFTAQAQNKITMQASIDSALHNNLMLNGEYLNVQYWQALKNTSYNFNPLTINSEYGQINSIFKDTRFGVNQAFALPSTYSRQKQLGSIKVGEAQNAFTLKSAELKQEIRSQYFRYIYLHQQEILLKSADSFFTAMLESAEIKLKLGETNTLERDYMKLQQFQVARQLEQINTDKANVLLVFQTLINTKEKYIPNDAVDNYMIIPQFSDTHFLNSHPTVKAAQLMISENKQLVKTEKSQLLPYLNLGYSNMSIQGMGSDNKTYNSSDRFQSVQLAINVPVFCHGYESTHPSIWSGGIAIGNCTFAGAATIKIEMGNRLEKLRKCCLCLSMV
jgi:cobalt-zinc-cadmium resistance protein CzcA